MTDSTNKNDKIAFKILWFIIGSVFIIAFLLFFRWLTINNSDLHEKAIFFLDFCNFIFYIIGIYWWMKYK